MASKPSDQDQVDRGFLGDASLRLSRLLDVAGIITPEFNHGERIIPVVLVGDGTTPGMGAQRGRRWMAHGTTAGGNNLHFRLELTAPGPLLIDRLDWSSDIADSVLIRFDPRTASVITGGTTTLLDRTGAAREPVPGLQAGSGLGAFGANLAQFSLAASTTFTLQFPFLLMPGAMLQFDPTGAGNSALTAYGRTF